MTTALERERGGIERLKDVALSSGLWTFVLVLAIPVVLYVINPAWLYTPPGWLDSFDPIGLGLNYADATIANTDYKISRLPWNLVEFIVRNSLRENVAHVVLQFSLIAASIASAARIGRALLRPLGQYVLMVTVAAFPLVTAASLRGGSDYQNAMAFPLFLALLATVSSLSPGNIRRTATWAGVTAALLLCVDMMYVQMIPYVALFTIAVLRGRDVGRRHLWTILKWVCAGGIACVAGLMLINASVGRGFFFFLPEWRFILAMLGNPAKDIWWEPLNGATLRASSHLAFLFVWGAIALVEFTWVALDRRADARPLHLAIHGGFVLELAIWTAWQLFGHHTALLPMYFAHPLYGPACVSLAAVVSRHVGAIGRRAAQVGLVLLSVASVVALIDAANLLRLVSPRVHPAFAVPTLSLLLFYLALVIVGALSTGVLRRIPTLAGSGSVCAVLLLPFAFASTAPPQLYAPTSCRLLPDFNRFIIESSRSLRRQVPHATDVFIWASPDETMAVSPACRAFWAGGVEQVADSLGRLSHSYVGDSKPHMIPVERIPVEQLRRIGANSSSIVAVVSSNRAIAGTLRDRFASAGVPMDAIGQLRPGVDSDLPSLYLLRPADARIAAGIKSQIAADPITASSTIDVTVLQGVARLSGVTESHAVRDRAFSIAVAAKGVTSVVNQIRFPDATLVQQVKHAVAADPLIRAVPIQVQSKDGIVTLTSDKTNQDQRTHAVRAARSVPGVLSVEDNMK